MVVALDRKVLDTGQIVQGEGKAVVAGRRQLTIGQVKFPVFGANGQVEGVGTVDTDLTGQRRAEESLNEIRRRLELAQRQAKVGYWRWSLGDEVLTYWSQEASEVSLYPLGRAPVNYQEMLAPVHPDDYERVLAEYKAADAEPRGFSLEYRVVHEGGRVSHIREIGEVEYDDTGEPVAHVGIVQDISELIAARETNDRLFTAIENLAESVALYDAEDRLVFANRKFWNSNQSIADRMGPKIPYGEYLRLLIENRMAPDAEGCEEEWLRERLDRHRNPGEPFEMNRQHGKVLQIQEQRLPDGGIATLATDITRLKKIENELRDSEMRLEGLLKIAPEAIIVVGADLRIQLFNLGAERIFGWTWDEMVGQLLDPLLPPTFRAAHPGYISRFAEAPESYRQMAARGEITGLRKDGTSFPAVASVSKLNQGGETVYIVALRDISELKRIQADLAVAKEEAESANRAKTEFLANMSHELRTPLNSIIGFSDILVDGTFGELGNPKYREYAKDINGSGRHLLELISDILDISKIETRETTVDEEPLDLYRIVRECRKLLEERVVSAKIALSVDVSGDMPGLLADSRLIKQILLNLVTNSIKFTPAGGQVLIRARVDGADCIRLDVVDTGVGNRCSRHSSRNPALRAGGRQCRPAQSAGNRSGAVPGEIARRTAWRAPSYPQQTRPGNEDVGSVSGRAHDRLTNGQTQAIRSVDISQEPHAAGHGVKIAVGVIAAGSRIFRQPAVDIARAVYRAAVAQHRLRRRGHIDCARRGEMPNHGAQQQPADDKPGAAMAVMFVFVVMAMAAPVAVAISIRAGRRGEGSGREQARGGDGFPEHGQLLFCPLPNYSTDWAICVTTPPIYPVPARRSPGPSGTRRIPSPL
jgi:PAS domain S-box-containing protein